MRFDTKVVENANPGLRAQAEPDEHSKFTLLRTAYLLQIQMTGLLDLYLR
jgi:hypothetical protein